MTDSEQKPKTVLEVSRVVQDIVSTAAKKISKKVSPPSEDKLDKLEPPLKRQKKDDIASETSDMIEATKR